MTRGGLEHIVQKVVHGTCLHSLTAGPMLSWWRPILAPITIKKSGFWRDALLDGLQRSMWRPSEQMRRYLWQILAKPCKKDWNLTPSRTKLWRARSLALKKIYGDKIEQYNELWDYARELRRSNPGSSFHLNLSNGHFNTYYMSLVWHPRCLHISVAYLLYIMCLFCLKKDLFVIIKRLYV